jgi:hypothetical protein
VAWTQADIDKLKAAIAGGSVVQSMTFADQSFEFRSLKDMLALLGVMQAEVNVVAGTSTSYRLAATSKGV